jgi:hypothetical protein
MGLGVGVVRRGLKKILPRRDHNLDAAAVSAEIPKEEIFNAKDDA